ncbi:MAG: hypothetical protein HY560_14435, partial [Gemmatimonadetes bacterium]|nr:hypothetical protein [Gemmatimonadota bacterium]
MEWRTFIRSPARRRVLIVASHLVLTALAYLAAFGLLFEFRVANAELRRFVETLPYLLVLRIALMHYFRLDRGYWQHVGVRDLLSLVGAITLASLAFPVALVAFRQLYGIPPTVFLLDWLLAIALLGGVRVTARAMYERRQPRPTGPGKRAFIIGAGEAGEQLLRQIQHDSRHHIHVVGLIDDDPAKRGQDLH